MGFYETLFKSILGNLDTSFGFPKYELASVCLFIKSKIQTNKKNKKYLSFYLSLTCN